MTIKESLEFYGVLEEFHQPLTWWIEDGYPLQGFLLAIVCNDLKTVCEFAHHEPSYRNAIYWVVEFLKSAAPSGSWGSKEDVTHWINNHDQIKAQSKHLMTDEEKRA